MRLLLAANNQATRRNEIIKSYLQLGSSSNRYAPRLPQQETKSSTKQLPPTGPILGPENILKTGFAQKGLSGMRKKYGSEMRLLQCLFCQNWRSSALESPTKGCCQYLPKHNVVWNCWLLSSQAVAAWRG